MVKGWYKAFMLVGLITSLEPILALAAPEFPTGEPSQSLSARIGQWKESQNQTLADKLKEQASDPKKPLPWVNFDATKAQANNAADDNPISQPAVPVVTTSSSPAASMPVTASSSNNSQATQMSVPAASATAATTMAASPTNNAAAPDITALAPVAIDQNLIREKAFQDVMQQAIPLSPSQIQQLRARYDESLQAASTAYDVPPQPVSSLQYVDLSPGATPPAVRLARGFVSSIAFVDATGAPWPIVAYDLGDPKSFSLEWDKNNVLMVQALTAYNYGNIAVKLQGEPTPIMLTLIPGQKQVDYRVDLHVQKVGPNAKESITIDNLPNTEKPVLLNVLNSIPPAGSKPVQVAGTGVQAWSKNGILYVRTQWTILSPGWLSVIESNDGMKAYEMQTTPMLLVSQYGKPVQINLKES